MSPFLFFLLPHLIFNTPPTSSLDLNTHTTTHTHKTIKTFKHKKPKNQKKSNTNSSLVPTTPISHFHTFTRP
ncbi:hypothetical protein QBC41DRAFT_312031 [Cercophora samala]|uniref:Uncharacterized protein n=1 Tax=Cercophora samala TaxID=330535 RepID=A0AA40DDY7_9PEZI|nr:hypothetical protein QBC41DRAFT_312031 [Cercophora samala]